MLLPTQKNSKKQKFDAQFNELGDNNYTKSIVENCFCGRIHYNGKVKILKQMFESNISDNFRSSKIIDIKLDMCVKELIKIYETS